MLLAEVASPADWASCCCTGCGFSYTLSLPPCKRLATPPIYTAEGTPPPALFSLLPVLSCHLLPSLLIPLLLMWSYNKGTAKRDRGLKCIEVFEVINQKYIIICRENRRLEFVSLQKNHKMILNNSKTDLTFNANM